MQKITTNRGILKIDNKNKFLLSADYPYYRDLKDNWDDRLNKIKNMGIDIITCYLPWRHHINTKTKEYDFSGKTQKNRDLLNFVELCKKNKLYLIVKPGPFIHAETNYGGLPDFVIPGNSNFKPRINCFMQPTKWQEIPLPSLFDSNFFDEVIKWYKKVVDTVISKFQYPNGPIIGIQILNEGMYSSMQAEPWAYDYCDGAIEEYRKYIEEKYKSLDNYNNIHSTNYNSWESIDPIVDWSPKNKSNILSFVDWSEFTSQMMKILYEKFNDFFRSEKINLPLYYNASPPIQYDRRLEWWLTRVVPEKFENINYGFTNWIGVVSKDDSAFFRYLTMCKRSKGPNLEENWGFSNLYDELYKNPEICYYQTIVALAAGATGFNIYTAVSTKDWDENLDSLHPKPYPATSPISEQGKLRDKYYTLRQMSLFLKNEEKYLLNSISKKPISWGLYLPYVCAHAWNEHEDDWKITNLSPPRSGFMGLDNFQKYLINLNIDFSIINLETEKLDKYPCITYIGTQWMDRSTQQKIIEYVKRGGIIISCVDLPEYDEFFRPYSYLEDRLTRFSEIEKNEKYIHYKFKKGHFILFKKNIYKDTQNLELFEKILSKLKVKKAINIEGGDAYITKHTYKNKDYLYIISKEDTKKEYKIKFDKSKFQITLPAYSAALVGVEDKKIRSILFKGINNVYNSHTKLNIKIDKHYFKTDRPCDLTFVEDKDKYRIDLYNTNLPLIINSTHKFSKKNLEITKEDRNLKFKKLADNKIKIN